MKIKHMILSGFMMTFSLAATAQETKPADSTAVKAPIPEHQEKVVQDLGFQRLTDADYIEFQKWQREVTAYDVFKPAEGTRRYDEYVQALRNIQGYLERKNDPQIAANITGYSGIVEAAADQFNIRAQSLLNVRQRLMATGDTEAGQKPVMTITREPAEQPQPQAQPAPKP